MAEGCPKVFYDQAAVTKHAAAKGHQLRCEGDLMSSKELTYASDYMLWFSYHTMAQQHADMLRAQPNRIWDVIPNYPVFKPRMFPRQQVNNCEQRIHHPEPK